MYCVHLLYNSFIRLVSLGSGRGCRISSGGSPIGGCYTVFSQLEVTIINLIFDDESTVYIVYSSTLLCHAGLPLRQQASPRGEKIITVISACYLSVYIGLY